MENSIIVTEEDIDNAAIKIGIDLETITQNDRNIIKVLIQNSRKITGMFDTMLEIQMIDWEIASLNEQGNHE